MPAWSPRNPRISVEILWRLLTQAWSLINSISSPSPLEDWGWGGKFQASNPGLGFPVTTPHLGATQGHLCGTEEALGDLLFCFVFVCVCVCVFWCRNPGTNHLGDLITWEFTGVWSSVSETGTDTSIYFLLAHGSLFRLASLRFLRVFF